MKKFNLILNIVSVVAVIALFVLYFTDKSCADKASTSSKESVSAQAGDIVFIDLDSLVNQYDMYNDLRSELEGKLGAIENDLNKKGRSLENDIKSFQEKMNKGLLTRSQAETMGNDLAMREQELRALTQQKQMEMQEEEAVMYNRVMDAINTYVDAYQAQMGYSLVLSTSLATNTVLSADHGLNITYAVVEGLNAEYVKNRNRK